MARSAATALQNNFSKGLITEATGLNFPENAATETFNCVYKPTGEVQRRKGFEFETGYEFLAYTPGYAIKHYLWKAVANIGTISFLVQQNGPIVSFLKVEASQPVSYSVEFTLDLDDHLSGLTEVTTAPAQFAAGSGRLFITHPQCEPLAVTYNDDTDDIEILEISVQVRDMIGIDDSLDIDEEPSTLSDEHHYNLLNQGWYQLVNALATGSSSEDSYTPRDPIVVWNEERPSTYPSNVAVWWAYKRPKQSGAAWIEIFRPKETYNNIVRNNTPAPKGHYIYNAFNIDRSTVSGVSGLTPETSGDARPSTVAFFAGRVFYSGVQSRRYGSKIYFSQIIERDEQFGRCYQNQDPTSDDAPDLLPSDGGVIVIPEVANILYMVAKGAVLFVFASNGVWQISGSEGIGFRANDYSVTKITDTPAVSASSFVIVDGNPVWINQTGIWTLTPAQVGLSFEIKSLSDTTIKQYVQSVPYDHKSYITGAFNPKTRIIQWAFAQDPDLAFGEADRVLNFNTLSGAFYPWSVSAAETCLRDVVTLESTTVDTYFAYCTYTPTKGLTFATETNDDFLDFVGEDNSGDGWDYESYGVVGYGVYGEGNKSFQSNYVTIHYRPEENGSCYIQGQWAYANNPNTGRWSTTQQVYGPKTPEDYDYASAKRKIRGQGKALQLRFKSVSGKPFSLTGWVVFVTGVGAV
jgi:hypothetical protein